VSRTADAGLRQAIVDAIVEPATADTQEVNVYIDRIDVRSSSTNPPAPQQPRAPKAAPTSLDSYLRARSRGAS
jgi:hypothetical protein